MKKILSLLLAFGLTATTSTTVVSCGTKKIEYTFKDLRSITDSISRVNEYGRFSTDDFGISGDGYVIIKSTSMPKLISYLAASFTNSEEAYQSLIQDKDLNAFVYQKNQKTGDFVNLANQGQLQDDTPTYVRFINKSKQSGYFLIKTIMMKRSNVFNLTNWFNNNTPEIHFKIDESVLNNQTLNMISKSIVSDYKEIKNGSLWTTNKAINDTFIFLGEYLLQIGDPNNADNYYISNYEETKWKITSIKQQFKNNFNQQSQDLKNLTREWIANEWMNVDFDINKKELPIQLKLQQEEQTTTVTILLDFRF